ncbi:solute carrier family 12 member 7 [Caerostris extrusa]|uniref:Solute carrier family 12 member 7 n=1 Tax=Caerostris extrusa TaxID=172846 RepID=A0AAV4WP98_CAEEX|nr:solute carrier family 12 member 7 [Caerostris extrusa]
MPQMEVVDMDSVEMVDECGSDTSPVLIVGKKFEIQRVEKTPESNENSISARVPCEACEKEATDLTNALQALLKDHRDGEPIISDGGNLSSYEKNLYLYHEEMPERPRVATLLNSLANYNVAIPSILENSVSAPKKANLGTIAGVYLPCIQNILGVIFFIRLSWIVGTAGVPLSFLVVFLCCCVTFTTCISLSAIATNGIVPAGGSYFYDISLFGT